MTSASLAPETTESVSTFNSEMRIEWESPANRHMEATAEHALIDAVHLALRATGYLSLRNLNVKVDSGSVRLQGTVRTYYLKQLAQSAVKQVPGIGRIANDVEVVCT